MSASQVIGFFLLAALSSGCLTSTPPQTGPIREPTRSGDWSGWKMKVTSLNVWGVPVIVSKDKKERMPLIGQAMAARKPDFVFLQEAWLQDQYDTIKKNSKLAHGQYFPDPRSTGSGLGMLATSGIDRKAFNVFFMSGQFSKITDGEVIADKGVASVTLRHQNLPITMIDTHLVARNGDIDGPAERYLTDRFVQMFQVWAQIVEQADSDAFVVAGDFNLRVINEAEFGFWSKLTSLQGNVIEDRDPAFCTSCADNVYNDGKNHGQIDYVFLSPRLDFQNNALDYNQAVFVKDSLKNYSDHYGWTSTIRVNPAKSNPSTAQVRSGIIEALFEVEARVLAFLDGSAQASGTDEVSTMGMEDKACRSCEARNALERIRLYQEAMTSIHPSGQAANLRVRLDSYIQMFR